MRATAAEIRPRKRASSPTLIRCRQRWQHNRGGAIVGFRHPDQIDPTLAAADIELIDEDAAEIEGNTR